MELDTLQRNKDTEAFEKDYVRVVVQETDRPRRKPEPGTARGSREPRIKYNDKQTGELDNIAKGVSPFKECHGGVSVRDQIDLSQKAYYNIACFRSAIDIMADLANARLKFTGSNKAAVKFYNAWEKKIQGREFRAKWFREWWRSCNLFLVRHFGDLTFSDFRKITRASVTKRIPLRYTILNPTEIKGNGAASFVDATYSKVLTPYEVKRLQSPNLNPDEKAFLESLPPAEQKKIKSGQDPEFQLTSDKFLAIFNGKQDYEPMATPCFYSVLQDINFKLELRKSEMVLARAADKFILLVTCGEKERDHSLNAKLIDGLTQAFAQDSIGRVVISDYTTKAAFVIPDYNLVFGEQKYKSINEDIANGLMNIFWKDESFSNSMIKIQIFLERLKTARESYVDLFLRPEMDLIARELGFQNIDDIEIEWEDFRLKDDLEHKKLYTRLCELGILTPDETFAAFETNRLPDQESSIEHQKEYKKLREENLYEPLIGGVKKENGRPPGSTAPKKKINPAPVGASTNETGFSLTKIAENVKRVDTINLLIETAYKEKNGITRLSKRHKDICWSITSSLITNEAADEWDAKIAEYLINPQFEGAKTDENFYFAAEHKIDPITAAILNNSRAPLSKNSVK